MLNFDLDEFLLMQDCWIALQVTLPKCKSPILIIFEYVVVDVKIRHTYFFLSAENHIYTPLHPFKFMGIDLIVLYIRI